MNPLLRLAALAYGGAVAMRNRRYDRPGASRRASLPVVSVGNLTVGGTGKTPLVAWLAERLRSSGRRPAVVSRGYRGRAGRGPLVVSDGGGPLCAAAVCGDEPHLLARRLLGVPVIVGSDRLAGVQAAAGAGCDIALLDDGFQHRRLERDLDLVLLDAGDPFGGGRLIPAGRLREPLEGLARADIVLLTRSGPADPIEAVERVVRQHNLQAPILRAGHRSVGFYDRAGAEQPSPPAAVAFCGIGNPDRFRSDLQEAGVELIAFHAFRDHHDFSAEELERLAASAGDRRVPLLTTEKDLARLAERGDGLLALRIEAMIHEPEPLLEALDRVLDAGVGA